MMLGPISFNTGNLAIDQGAEKILRNFIDWPGRSERIDSKKIVRELLKMDFFFSRGEMFAFYAKHIGCGVYEITAKEKNV